MRRMAMFAGMLYLIIVLTACDQQSGTSLTPRSSALIDPEAYGAMPALFQNIRVVGVRVHNDFGGDVTVVAHEVSYAQEVTLDYTAYNSAADPVQGSADARRAVNVTMSYAADGWVDIWARPTQQVRQPDEGVRLHLRVPRNIDLDLHTSSGRITVAGEVNKVYANATSRIEVRGALGALGLVTTSGGIVADGGHYQHIETHTENSNITIYSVGASVTAAISGTGSIEFVGTLAGRDNSFLTATGPITVALPEDVPYSFYVATTGGRLINDFRPDKGSAPGISRPVCGLIFNGQRYDYHVRYLDDIYGHLDVALANAGTYVSGTLGTDLYYFFTDRSDVTFYTPYPHAIHIYAADASNSVEINKAGKLQGVPDCERLPPEPEVRLTARTQSGLVFIHHIRMNLQYAADP